MLAKYGLERRGSSLRERVNVGNQAVDIGGHDEQVSKRFRSRIPVCMWSASRHQDTGAGAGFDDLVPRADAENALKDIPGLVVVVVQMQRGDQPGLCGNTAFVLPLGDYEIVVRRPDGISGQRRRENGRSHFPSEPHAEAGRKARMTGVCQISWR